MNYVEIVYVVEHGKNDVVLICVYFLMFKILGD